MPKSIAVVLLLLSLGACAARPDPRLSLPYSERTDIIHAYEAINFIPVDKGEKKHILFYKSAPADTLRQYRRFDTRAITQSNVVYDSINSHRAAARMRQYIVAKLTQAGFKHTGKAASQAGIAVTLSAYQKIPGRHIEELMMVVFDRNKARELAEKTPGMRGYQLLKETAIWVGVVRQAPSPQRDIPGAVHIVTATDFRNMVDLMFEGFMLDSRFLPMR